MTHAGDLREAFLTLYGTGAMHGAAGLVRDVAIAQARRETPAGRMLLVHMLGPAADSVLASFRDGPGVVTEALLPLLAHPLQRFSPPGRVPDLARAIEAAGLPEDLRDDDLAAELRSNLAGPA